MQSASPRFRLSLDTGLMWERARGSMGGGRVWSAVFVVLLTYTIARSTATAGWVSGIEVITVIAVGAAVALGVLAILPLPSPIGLGAGTVAAPIVAVAGAWPAIHARHPDWVLNSKLPGIYWTYLTGTSSDSAANDTSFYLMLICLLMWIAGGWLAWCVLRWRKPLLGLIPGAAAFATNVLNIPQDQNGYTLAMLVLTLLLLLWANYSGSIASASRAHVKLMGDARWDFWESGLVATAALIVLGILLPPLSTVDRTSAAESSMFSSWAQMQERLSRPGIFNAGLGNAATTGFSTEVRLYGPIQRTRDPVFTYTVVGAYPLPQYFRGVDVTQTSNNEWRYPSLPGAQQRLQKNEVPFLAPSENYQKLAVGGFDVKMISPPSGNQDILFYPGEFYRVDRVTVASAVPVPLEQSNGQLTSIDRLSSFQPPTSTGKYNITVEYSTATAQDLQTAGTNYPDWLASFMTLPPTGYRSPDVLQAIHSLAVQIVTAAGAKTPYDDATAIETYLRSDLFTYTLDPVTPPDQDPIYYFLFKSHRGFCEYFASAMGDMLRSLGIPTRLVNGFGPGQFDAATQSYVVRDEDAHTWVEVYFPSYGWIQFEPTKQDSVNVYATIPRGATAPNQCLRADGCDTPGGADQGGGTGLVPGVNPHTGNREDPGSAAGAGGFSPASVFAPANLTKLLAVLLGIVLLVVAGIVRYLRPRSVMAVWKRTLALASLAGAERRPGETPLELGRRLQRTFPEASEPAGELTRNFAVAAYAPPDLAESARPPIMDAWYALRPMLLRRIIARLRRSRG